MRCRRAGSTGPSRSGKQQCGPSAEELGHLGLRRRRDVTELAGRAPDVVDCGLELGGDGNDRGGSLKWVVAVGGELVAGSVEFAGESVEGAEGSGLGCFLASVTIL